MKNNKKSYIDTYETVYPIHLVVANSSAKLEELSKLYTYSDGKELDDSILYGVCTTTRAKRKSDGRCISLVKFNHVSEFLSKAKQKDIEADMVNTYTHEACHVVLDTYEFIGEQPSTQYQETFAYQVGWVAECIYRTLSKK